MDLSRQEFLEVSFLDYYSKIAKRNNKVNDNIPKNLIKTYFSYMDHMPFNKVADNYRRKYILNENRLESVHNASEREGLRVVYDYVLSDEWKNFSNIYVILNDAGSMRFTEGGPSFVPCLFAQTQELVYEFSPGQHSFGGIDFSDRVIDHIKNYSRPDIFRAVRFYPWTQGRYSGAVGAACQVLDQKIELAASGKQA